ncbi:hypothetical protein [Luteolibacter soli]|uniref:DNA-binding protein n=1 Tax=Luteolibacter soli TaxID=3135280 RepID=A0ABU9ASC0_9BACT
MKSAAAYSDFSVSAIESALRLGQLDSRTVKIKGERKARRIKREWLDKWIEGEPVESVGTLAEQIAREVVRLMREA